MEIDFKVFGRHDVAVINFWYADFASLLPYIGLLPAEVGALCEFLTLNFTRNVKKIDTVVFFNVYKAFKKLVAADYLYNIYPSFYDSCTNILPDLEDVRRSFLTRNVRASPPITIACP